MIDQTVVDKQIIKQQFEFAGFKVNHQALVEEIFKQIKYYKSSNFTSLETQNIRKAIDKIMKDLTSDTSNFSKIFSYSANIEGENAFSNRQHQEKIISFKQQVTYEIIAKMQKEILLPDKGKMVTEDGKTYYDIPKEFLPVIQNDIKEFGKNLSRNTQDEVKAMQEIQTRIYSLSKKEGDFFDKIGNFFMLIKAAYLQKDL